MMNQWEQKRISGKTVFTHPVHGWIWTNNGGLVWHSQHVSERNHVPDDDNMHPTFKGAVSRLSKMTPKV